MSIVSEPATTPPPSHGAPPVVRDFDLDQLNALFEQLDAMGRRVALDMLAGLVRLKAGAR